LADIREQLDSGEDIRLVVSRREQQVEVEEEEEEKRLVFDDGLLALLKTLVR